MLEQAWAEISQELSAAYQALQRANEQMSHLGNVEHIRANLEPHIEAIERFRDLAREKRREAEGWEETFEITGGKQ
jgi:hypothetical protein